MPKPQQGGGFSAAEFSVAEALTTKSLDIVEQRYGSGYPYFRGGEQPLCYHNRWHSEAVSKGADQMGEALGLSPSLRAIGRLAGSAHDIVQLKPRGVMEEESAEWLGREMFKTFRAYPIEIAMLAIRGTEPIFEGGNLRQKVSELTFPTKDAELVAMSVACADLGELYSPLGPRMSHELYKEMNDISPNQRPSVRGLINFQKSQVNLVRNFQFPHPQGERVFGRLRNMTIEYHEDLLYHLQSGEINTWREVLEADDNFRWAASRRR